MGKKRGKRKKKDRIYPRKRNPRIVSETWKARDIFHFTNIP
jgi:hypothetical protein